MFGVYSEHKIPVIVHEGATIDILGHFLAGPNGAVNKGFRIICIIHYYEQYQHILWNLGVEFSSEPRSKSNRTVWK